MKANDLRPGMAIRHKNKLHLITKVDHRTPGNLRAFVQVKMKDILIGGVIEDRFASTAEVEQVEVDRREMEYLFSDNTGHVFMDTENFDQITMQDALIGDALKMVKANTKIIVLMSEEKPITIELPKTVDLKVVDTPPGVKGGTATNVMKEATLETGLKTRVPEFIKPGEMVRISTEDGSYLSRV